MRTCYILIILFLPLCSFASGNPEKIVAPDHSTVIAVENRFTTDQDLSAIRLSLPYLKPQGIVEIFHPKYSYMEGILIENLIVDGSEVSAKRGTHGYDPSDIQVISVSAESEIQLYDFILGYWWGKNPYVRGEYWDFDRESSELTPMLGYKDSTTIVHRPRSARELRIPIDAKEAYMTYRIVFPNGSLSDPETVYWKFDWPEDFGWD